jgi:prepilin-type N-terminal cleavage/methylation domain-containing protein
MSAKQISKRIRLRAARGFTLVELMISLVMGLIVALAAVALAKAATTTFHEQARSSITEMSVRSGAERLRQDLTRIAFMSTPNINTDTSVASVVGGPNARYAALEKLQGIRINVQGSLSGMSGALTAANLLAPDSIDITGNLTTDDIYHGTITTGGTCGGQVVTLDPLADAAVYSLIGPNSPDGGAFTAFQPVPGANFIARVTDANGCNHFVPICGVAIDGSSGRSMAQISLLPDGSSRAVLYAVNGTLGANYSVNRSCGASEGGDVAIAPVHRVRWALTPSPPGLDTGDKFDLTRQFLDATNTPAGAAEIVAEYAVDLKFGIVVRDPVQAALNRPAELVYDLDSDPGTGDIFNAMNGTGPGGLGPENVRSVRFRLATRTSIPDREADIQIGPNPRSTTNPYMVRYCMAGALATCNTWSRVRTIVSEVALHNQARASLP